MSDQHADISSKRSRFLPPEPESSEDTATEAAPETEERVSWAKLTKYLIITIVSMFLLLVIVDKIVMPWYVKLGAVESVPNVVGLTFEEARKELEDRGFEVKEGEARFDNRYAVGTVVQQLPYGGAETKRGRRIYLTLSRGVEMIPMHDVVGLPLREARINLMRKGFEIGEVEYQYNDTIMRDLVFSQSIPGGVEARPGTTVDVVISRGPETRYTVMPNLVSMTLDQARTRLENAGLVLGVVQSRQDNSYSPNTVVQQSVASYSRVSEGAAVDITVAQPVGSDGGGEERPDQATPRQPALIDDEPQVKNLGDE